MLSLFRSKKRRAHLAIEFGVFIKGVVELLGTLFESQREHGFTARVPLPFLKVLFLKQRAQILC